MIKYIDAEELKEKITEQMESLPREIGRGAGTLTSKGYGMMEAFQIMRSIIDSLQQEQKDMGEVSDGYHTFNELYYYRMLYNAAFFNLLPKEWVHKSKKHHTGEECFGGGWFIVMANLPTGQISNHYELKDWDLFKVPVKEFADEWDGHTPQEAADRLHKYLQQEQPGLPGIEKSGIPGKDYIPVEWVDACEKHGKWKIVKQEQPESNIPSVGSRAMGTTPPKFKLEVKEQPVEELKELRKEVIKFSQDHFDELHSDMETIDIVHIIARHFVEWGRKQVLQEIYEGKVKPVDKITAAWLNDE